MFTFFLHFLTCFINKLEKCILRDENLRTFRLILKKKFQTPQSVKKLKFDLKFCENKFNLADLMRKQNLEFFDTPQDL